MVNSGACVHMFILPFTGRDIQICGGKQKILSDLDRIKYSKETNIFVVSSVLTNISITIAFLQLNINLLLILDQRKRQNEE